MQTVRESEDIMRAHYEDRTNYFKYDKSSQDLRNDNRPGFFRDPPPKISREELNTLIEDFIVNGGKVQVIL